MSKDEKSKYIYDILKDNISEAKDYFYENKTALTECEEEMK